MKANPKTTFNLTFFLRFTAVIVVLVGIGIAAYAAYGSSDKADTKQVFADRTMLAGLWNSYKTNYWESSTGRTVDKQSNNITTSEGQSYTMLRAVWQSDKSTFDTAWGWTKQQLQRQDKLFAWKWGLKTDGTYGILTDVNGNNTASDADADIALALVMAASRWQQQSYLNDAKAIIPSIWNTEVVTIKGTPYFAANNLEKLSQNGVSVVNPSYISPAAFRIFARLDTAAGHDWNGLVGASYAFLNTVIDGNLDKSSSAKLVPDWVIINKTTGEITAPGAAQGTITTNYGYEAFRTPWRLGLDYAWNKSADATSTLARLSYLSNQWAANQKLSPVYSHDGLSLAAYESTGAYGGDLAYFMSANPTQAKQVYDKKLKYLYDPNKNDWSQTLSYYDANWAWFGMALYTNQLDNLAAS